MSSTSYPLVRVALGQDPHQVLAEMMFRHGGGDHLYFPDKLSNPRILRPSSSGEDHDLSAIHKDWIEKFHQGQSEYALRNSTGTLGRVSHHTVAPDFRPGDNKSGPFHDQNHHWVNADVLHVPTNTRVGDFGFSLGRWPYQGKGGHYPPVVTAHVHTFFKDPHLEHDEHPHAMQHVLDSWLGHVKQHGVNFGFVEGDISRGYWVRNITRHPDIAWGGVERVDTDQGPRTRPYKELVTRYKQDTFTGRMARDNEGRPIRDRRAADLIKTRQDLFRGWPIESVQESDAFVMKWNQEHPQPDYAGGPLQTTLYRFEHGRLKTYPGHLDKQCYYHALRLAKRNPRMKLAIGFIVDRQDAASYEKGGPKPLMFSHAFNVTSRGEVHDPTLGSDGLAKLRYYGHVVPDPKKFKTSQDLANWFGHHFQVGHDRGPGGVHLGIQTPEIIHER